MPFTLDWEPKGRTLDAYKLTRTTDGDTPFVEMPIRMLSIDTPEVHYPGTMKPSALEQLGKDLKAGKYPKLPAALSKYLRARLDAKAGTRQLEQGEESSKQYARMLDERMKTPSGRGRRKLSCVRRTRSSRSTAACSRTRRPRTTKKRSPRCRCTTGGPSTSNWWKRAGRRRS